LEVAVKVAVYEFAAAPVKRLLLGSEHSEELTSAIALAKSESS
jgi:hypothetical protein